MREAHDHLAAIVAIWFLNGQEPVDGANDPREFASNDWFGAATLTEDLVVDGLLRLIPGPYAEEPGHMVVPTASGLYEVLR